MERYTQEQHLQIIILRLSFYGRNNRISMLAIRRIVANFELM